ncbi:hypothetical protein ACRAWD_02875 [Caulobacter segnis]
MRRGHRTSTGGNPSTDTCTAPAPVFPGWSLSQIYPAGFSPKFGQDETNASVIGGLRGEAMGWSWDASAGWGSGQGRLLPQQQHQRLVRSAVADRASTPVR